MTEHDQWLKEQLQDADFAAEYLNAAQEDDDPQVYLLALRKVVEARSSIICRGKPYIAPSLRREIQH